MLLFINIKFIHIMSILDVALLLGKLEEAHPTGHQSSRHGGGTDTSRALVNETSQPSRPDGRQRVSLPLSRVNDAAMDEIVEEGKHPKVVCHKRSSRSTCVQDAVDTEPPASTANRVLHTVKKTPHTASSQAREVSGPGSIADTSTPGRTS